MSSAGAKIAAIALTMRRPGSGTPHALAADHDMTICHLVSRRADTEGL
jgi:hypothetical protein